MIALAQQLGANVSQARRHTHTTAPGTDLDELLVVRDDNQLEALVALAALDERIERIGQGAHVLLVEVRSRFVQRQNAFTHTTKGVSARPRTDA